MDHLDIVKRLCDNNCDTYVVGGGIRDMLMGFNPEDFDVVTQATPDHVIELFSDCDVKLVGKSFGVVLVDGYEVATFRNDIYKDGVCTVAFAETIHDDLSRRDLTVNAMAYCELTGEIIDDHGGKSDLENRVIKFVGDPNDRILEDPNRIIRACRFVAKIDGTFDLNTLTALKGHGEVLPSKGIAPERIRLEILKAMKIQKASKFFEALKLIGVLKWIFPKLDDCWKHPHGNHHEEDVFDHCMICGDSISIKYPILKLAGYLHDVGKPEAYTSEDQKFIFHEVIGSKYLQSNLTYLTFSKDEVQKIYGLVKLHMNSIQKMGPKAIRKLLQKFNDEGVEISEFLRLRMADRKANLARENFSLSEWKTMKRILTYENAKELPFNVHSLAIKGGDLIKEFGLKPGPVVSTLHKQLLNYVIEEGTEVNTYKNLLEKASEMLEI